MRSSFYDILHNMLYRNYLLMFFVFFTVFIIPALPTGWHKVTYNIFFTCIYFMAAFSMERHRKRIILMAVAVFILEWVSAFIGLKYIYETSRLLTIVFFIIIVFNLIAFIARSKEVDSKVILDAINGYLLLSIVFAMLIVILTRIDPAAFSFPAITQGIGEFSFDFSAPMYFSLVTTTTLGYGDIVPITSAARSLSTLIAVSGQLYIAIIIAMLVGKYASRQS